MNLQQLTINQAHQGLVAKDFSARELTAAYLERIKKLDGKIKAFITIDEKNALDQADKLDQAADFSSPLAGIPMAVKDVFCTNGLKSTGASKILENYIPPFDATAVAKLKEQKAVILGKLNCDEFAQGGSGENSGFFVIVENLIY